MTISFEQLIKVAPFDDQTRKQIMEQMPSLTADQKYELTKVAWTMIATVFQAELKAKTDQILLDVAQNKRAYNQNDFVEAQVALYHDLGNRFELTEKEEGLKEIRSELEKYMQPFKQDPQNNTSDK